jgi:glycosyltransferase involved in cell wall biosynthesis
MDPSRPLVSIGLPVYNGERFVARALESLVTQDFDDMEVIVSDNGSTDATPDICRCFAARDPRVRYHRADVNRGASWNFNRTLELARGRYFKWAAYDDLCAQGYVRRATEILEEAPSSVVLCYPKTLVIDEDDRVIGEFEDGLDLRQPEPEARLRQLLASRTEYHPVFGLMRVEPLRAAGGIGGFVASDVALLARLSLIGQFWEIPERLFLRRFHGDTSVNANPTFVDRAAWFDPANRARAALPMSRLTAEFLRSVRSSDLDSSTKLRCSAVVLRHWAVPHWRHMGGELKIAVRDKIRARPAASR